jgi:adenylylsulfate kinase
MSTQTSNVPATIPVLVITGPVGVGKTTVAGAISEILSEKDVAHAVVDLDWLRWCYPTPSHDPFHTALGLRNLTAVWANYRAAGAERLVLVDIVETRAMLAEYRAAVPGAHISVVRLRASLPTILSRLDRREVGASLAWHRQRAADLIMLMEHHRIEDLVVDTEGKPVMDIAWEVLMQTGWADIPRP